MNGLKCFVTQLHDPRVIGNDIYINFLAFNVAEVIKHCEFDYCDYNVMSCIPTIADITEGINCIIESLGCNETPKPPDNRKL